MEQQQCPIEGGDLFYIPDQIKTFTTYDEFLKFHEGTNPYVRNGDYQNKTPKVYGETNPEYKEKYFNLIVNMIKNYANKNKIKLNKVYSQYGFTLEPLPGWSFYCHKTKYIDYLPISLNYRYMIYICLSNKTFTGGKKILKYIKDLARVMGVNCEVHVVKPNGIFNTHYF